MRHAVTLDALRVLKAIKQQGSFASAAKVLHKVPSALTYTMQKLENDLGIQLFDRQGQRAVLTQAAHLLLQEGEAILQATLRLEDKVKQIDSGWEARLRIAKDTIVPDAPLFDLIYRFNELNIPLDIQISQESLGGGWDALHGDRADLAIGVSGDLPMGHYHLLPIGEVSFVFAIAADHPLASLDDCIETEQLNDYAAIVVADSSSELPARSSGVFSSKNQIVVPDMASKLMAQCKGLGVGFLPYHLARHDIESGRLVVKQVEIPRPPIALYAAWKKANCGKALNWFGNQAKGISWFDGPPD